MDPGLISKRELLEAAGISYGQLYRWKRKGLIPEDWFLRKSTFTGQETFFPRDKVLARIEKIKSMKDEDASLDEIAEVVAPDLGEVSLTVAEVHERRLVSDEALALFSERHPHAHPLAFGELVSLSVLDRLLKSGNVTETEGKIVLDALETHYPAFDGRDADLLVVRRMGLSTALLVSASAEVRFDSSARVIERINLGECAEGLRLKMR